ncbi:MAG: DUF362 domain-containing protein [Desulfobacterales bacterium]|nr:MAG: DUF362 domain-containing protein [Desulfobacterales bacterium]
MPNKPKPITRRDFIRGTIGATFATSMFGVKWALGDEKTVRSSLVTVVRDKNVMGADLAVDFKAYQKMLDQALIKFTGEKNVRDAWLSLIQPEDTVGLVTTGHLNPTHDELVYAVKIALMDIGVPKKKIKMAQGGSRKAKACTALISLPALKAHWLTGIGTVLKNYIMYSDSPSLYHDEDSAKLGEIWNLPHVKGKTKIVLVDALYPLCDKGPQPDPRYKWAYNGLIAGTDPVAVETVCLKIVTEKRQALRGEPWPLSPPPICLEAADKVYGLGTSRMEEIKIEHYGWEQDLLL